MDISLYEQLPRDIGDIQTSHCMNSFKGLIDIWTSHLLGKYPACKGSGSARSAKALGQWECKGSGSARATGVLGQRERQGSRSRSAHARAWRMLGQQEC